MFFLFTAIAVVNSMQINVDSSSLTTPKETFIFVRHGSTDWTYQNLDQGPQDLLLSEAGEKEAKFAAKIIKLLVKCNQEEYLIISSPLKRAIKTAEIISEEIKVPIVLNLGLEERYFGDFSQNKNNSLDFIPFDAETDKSFQKRMSNTLNSIFKNEEIKFRKKIIVSHGEVFKYLSIKLVGNSQTIPRGGVCVFQPNDNSNLWSVKFLDVL